MSWVTSTATVRALKAGTAGYMNKETAPKESVNVIRKIHAGGKYVSDALAEKLAASLEENARVARVSFQPRVSGIAPDRFRKGSATY